MNEKRKKLTPEQIIALDCWYLENREIERMRSFYPHKEPSIDGDVDEEERRKERMWG